MKRATRWLPAIAAVAVLARAGAAQAAPRRPPQIAAWVGFSHWFGATFASPDGIGTPTFGLGVRPAVAFLELRTRYTVALAPLALPGGGQDANVGFFSLELALTHGLAVGIHRIDLAMGPLAAVVHANGARGGGGFLVGARWTLALGRAVALGPFFEGRQVFYTLPGDRGGLLDDPRRDGQIDLGVVATGF